MRAHRAVRDGPEEPGERALRAAGNGPEELGGRAHRAVRDGLAQLGDRAFRAVRDGLEELGDMVLLGVRTLVSAVRPPHPYGEELVAQFLFVLRVCWLPVLIGTAAFNYAAIGVQAVDGLRIYGALDRLGGFFVLSAVREIGPNVTAIVVAGGAGTAITADLGARKIREELDALQVLGVDTVKSLVVPRFLALVLVTGMFNVYAILFGILAGVFATLVNHQPLGPFWTTFFSNADSTDLWGSVLKCTVFGAIIAIVCCYKGMNASGGPQGVGRAVNQAIVITVLAESAFNYAFTQMLLATHPNILVVR